MGAIATWQITQQRVAKSEPLARVGFVRQNCQFSNTNMNFIWFWRQHNALLKLSSLKLINFELLLLLGHHIGCSQ